MYFQMRSKLLLGIYKLKQINFKKVKLSLSTTSSERHNSDDVVDNESLTFKILSVLTCKYPVVIWTSFENTFLILI